jgi:hypothetical protein
LINVFDLLHYLKPSRKSQSQANGKRTKALTSLALRTFLVGGVEFKNTDAASARDVGGAEFLIEAERIAVGVIDLKAYCRHALRSSKL